MHKRHLYEASACEVLSDVVHVTPCAVNVMTNWCCVPLAVQAVGKVELVLHNCLVLELTLWRSRSSVEGVVAYRRGGGPLRY